MTEALTRYSAVFDMPTFVRVAEQITMVGASLAKKNGFMQQNVVTSAAGARLGSSARNAAYNLYEASQYQIRAQVPKKSAADLAPKTR